MKQARPIHTASPAERILERVRFIGAVMANGTGSVTAWAFEGALLAH
jgi:hypothetical protein